MCQQQTTQSDLDTIDSNPAVPTASLPIEDTGSRRRRLWELPVAVHCPVIGICIPADLLRKSLRKVIDADLIISDYDFHIGTVGHSRSRNPVSTLLQKLLDRRFALEIRLFQTVKTKAGLAELWTAAIRTGDVAGTFWAALTHPQCNEKMQTALVHDMHLLQHQACAMFRTSTKDMRALEQHNTELATALSETQAQYARQLRQTTEKAACIAGLQGQLFTAQRTLHEREEKVRVLETYLATVLALVPEMDSLISQQKQADAVELRNQERDKKIRELEHQLERQTTQNARARVDAIVWSSVHRKSGEDNSRSDMQAGPDAATVRIEKMTESAQLKLPAKHVLCVGGRAGKVPDYRDIIEKAGALFAHHDGGIKDKQSLLEASLAAADMVICQTGCISHNAYWRVKDFCKRTGKQCVYVDNPSTSSLIKSLKIVVSKASDQEILAGS